MRVVGSAVGTFLFLEEDDVMKNLLIVLALTLVGLAAGCTPVDSKLERERRISQITDMQMHMLVDDWDYLLLRERSSSLSLWHAHIGQ